MSKDEYLTAEQKKLLSNVDIGSDVIVFVKYKFKNSVTHNSESSIIHSTVTLVPEREAEYIGGNEQMTTYFTGKGLAKIFETNPKERQQITVEFLVSDKGEITNPKVTRTSGDIKIDELVLDAISKMPRWKAAENSKGIKINQEFGFSMGGWGGC